MCRADVLRFGALLVVIFFFFFFFSLFFARVPFSDFLTEVTLNETRGLFFLYYFFLFLKAVRPPRPLYYMWSIPARPTRNPAMSAAQLFTPYRAPHGMISTSLTTSLSGRSHQVGRSVIILRRPRVLEILSEPNFCPLPPPLSLLYSPTLRLSALALFWSAASGNLIIRGNVILDHGLSAVFTI